MYVGGRGGRILGEGLEWESQVTVLQHCTCPQTAPHQPPCPAFPRLDPHVETLGKKVMSHYIALSFAKEKVYFFGGKRVIQEVEVGEATSLRKRMEMFKPLTLTSCLPSPFRWQMRVHFSGLGPLERHWLAQGTRKGWKQVASPQFDFEAGVRGLGSGRLVKSLCGTRWRLAERLGDW